MYITTLSTGGAKMAHFQASIPTLISTVLEFIINEEHFSVQFKLNFNH
jgi:hypothetical protein